MKYINEKVRTISFQIRWLSISKFILFVFLLYMNWIKEIWGDIPIILYGSVIVLTLSLLLHQDEGEKYIDLECITDYYIVLLMFGFYCLISGIIVCVNRYLFISSMVTYFSYLVVFYDICLIAKRDKGWGWLLNTVLLVALICCVYALLFGVTIHNSGAEALTLSTINNPHILALVYLIGIFGLMANRETGFHNIAFKLFVMLLLCYGILRTGSRKSLLAMLLFLAVWFIAIMSISNVLLPIRTKVVFYLCILISIIFVFLYIQRFYIGSDQFERLMRFFSYESDHSSEDRIQMYKLSWDLWKAHPIFGVGFNQYQLYSWRGDYSHSTYAEVLACTGIIGTVILFVPILYYFCNVIKLTFSAPRGYRYYYEMCIAGFLMVFFLGSGQVWMYGLSHELFFFCIFGVMDDCKIVEIPDMKEKNKGKRKWKYLR